MIKPWRYFFGFIGILYSLALIQGGYRYSPPRLILGLLTLVAAILFIAGKQGGNKFFKWMVIINLVFIVISLVLAVFLTGLWN